MNASTRFILGSKVSRLLATAQRGSLYAKYPRMFRVSGFVRLKTIFCRCFMEIFAVYLQIHL